MARKIGGLREETEHLNIFLFFPPITQRCSISNVLFIGGRGASDFSVLKYCWLNINYSVNILSECLLILIDCSQLSKTYYNVLFGSSHFFCRRLSYIAYIGGRFRRTKITNEASDVAENLQLYRVVRFFLRDRHARHTYQRTFRE